MWSGSFDNSVLTLFADPSHLLCSPVDDVSEEAVDPEGDDMDVVSDMKPESATPHASRRVILGQTRQRDAVSRPAVAQLDQMVKPLLERMVSLNRSDVAMATIAQVYGLRNLSKQPLQPHQLNAQFSTAYRHVKSYLSLPGREAYLEQFLQTEGLTRRVLHYFVVQYAHTHPVEYYTNTSVYPRVVCGGLGRQIMGGSFVQGGVWVNLYQAYQTACGLKRNRNLMAPYARGPVVREPETGRLYPLCSLNFLVWFDQVGGPDAFVRLKAQVLLAKQEFDRESRLSVVRRKQTERTVLRKLQKRRKITAQDHGSKNFESGWVPPQQMCDLGAQPTPQGCAVYSAWPSKRMMSRKKK